MAQQARDSDVYDTTITTHKLSLYIVAPRRNLSHGDVRTLIGCCMPCSLILVILALSCHCLWSFKTVTVYWCSARSFCLLNVRYAPSHCTVTPKCHSILLAYNSKYCVVILHSFSALACHPPISNCSHLQVAPSCIVILHWHPILPLCCHILQYCNIHTAYCNQQHMHIDAPGAKSRFLRISSARPADTSPPGGQHQLPANSTTSVPQSTDHSRASGRALCTITVCCHFTLALYVVTLHWHSIPSLCSASSGGCAFPFAPVHTSLSTCRRPTPSASYGCPCSPSTPRPRRRQILPNQRSPSLSHSLSPRP